MTRLEDQLREALATASFELLRAEEYARTCGEVVVGLRALVDRVKDRGANPESLGGVSVPASVVTPGSVVGGSASPLFNLSAGEAGPASSVIRIVGDVEGSAPDPQPQAAPVKPVRKRHLEVLRCDVAGCDFTHTRVQSMALHAKKHARAAAKVADEPPASPVVEVAPATDAPRFQCTEEGCSYTCGHLVDMSGHTLREHGRHPSRTEKAGATWLDVKGAVA